MNLTYFRPEMRVSVEKPRTQSTSDLSPKHQTSEIYLKTSHLMSRWNIRSGNTGINDPELLVQSRGSRKRTAPLFRHKG